jgi:hypothetical protein
VRGSSDPKGNEKQTRAKVRPIYRVVINNIKPIQGHSNCLQPSIIEKVALHKGNFSLADILIPDAVPAVILGLLLLARLHCGGTVLNTIDIEAKASQ